MKTSLQALSQIRCNYVGPVTALATFPEHECTSLLAAVGPVIQIYDLKSKCKTQSIRAFAQERCHGIRVSQSRALVFGGQSFATAKFSKYGWCEIAPLKERRTHDWILDGCLVSSDEAILITAHNEVLIYNGPELTAIHKAEERPLLYSAALHYEVSTETLQVAVGTVFSQILLWKIDLRRTAVRTKSQGAIHSRLSGHEGVIFDLSWDRLGKYLASCSDDRSVRLWNTHSGECENVGWGHAARVWRVAIVNGIRLISTSEDATARIWSVSKTGALNQDRVLDGHIGKHIWSFAWSDNSIWTGGADGKLLQWRVTTIQKIASPIPCTSKSNSQTLEGHIESTFANVTSFAIIDLYRFLASYTTGQAA